MFRSIFTLLTVFLFNFANAQFVEVSLNEGYTQQVFYQFDNDHMDIVENTDWDIAFSTDIHAAAIHLNEATGLDENQVELYLAPTNDFDTRISVGDLDEQLYNDEFSWENGAFNLVRENTGIDFGWGSYNAQTRSVEGTRVFVLKLRKGNYKKIKFESLSSNAFAFRFADLDGSNEVNATVDLNRSTDGKFIYYSIANEEEVRKVERNWDLLFTRYNTPVDDGIGGFLDYSVSGVLSAPGVEVAEVNESPQNAGLPDFTEYLPDLDLIGYDWKDIDIENVIWTINTERTYFVRLRNGVIWRVHFIDFEGVSTGTMVFEKFVASLASTEGSDLMQDVAVFPNPIQNQAEITFSLDDGEDVSISIFNMMGQQVYKKSVRGKGGFNAVAINDLNLMSGTYALVLNSTSGKSVSTKIVVQ